MDQNFIIYIIIIIICIILFSVYFYNNNKKNNNKSESFAPFDSGDTPNYINYLDHIINYFL